MKRIILVKVLYYLFFAVIFLLALIIFLEIINFSFYDNYLRDFFHKILNILNF